MFNLNIKKIFQDKEFLITVIFAAVCLLLSVIFPAKSAFQVLTKNGFFLCVIPIFYIKFVLKKPLGEFGLNLKNKKTGIIWGVSMLIISLALMYLIVNFTSFADYHKISSWAISSFWFFMFQMFVLVNLALFFQEYFFRGFLISFFSPKMYAWSILIQLVIYAFVAIITIGEQSKILWQLLPFLIMSASGGVIAYKSRSMIYSWISNLFFLMLTNAYVIHLVKFS